MYKQDAVPQFSERISLSGRGEKKGIRYKVCLCVLSLSGVQAKAGPWVQIRLQPARLFAQRAEDQPREQGSRPRDPQAESRVRGIAPQEIRRAPPEAPPGSSLEKEVLGGSPPAPQAEIRETPRAGDEETGKTGELFPLGCFG